MLLEAKDIYKSYQQGNQTLKILKGISVSIVSGEFVTIMGASGSGKSTLLNILSSLDQPDKGVLKFQGQDILTMPEDQTADIRKNQMGFVFQEATFLKNLNILDNILLPHLLRPTTDITLLKDKALAYMKELDIEGLEERGIQEVSGGQLQRAGICRAILHDPQILFADEPTGALNSKSSLEVMEIFQRLHQKGTAILMVTHDPKIAAFAQKTLLMRDGQTIDKLEYTALGLSDYNKKVQLLSQTLLSHDI